MRPTCGCGRIATYEVYESLQPHCTSCMEDATDSKVPVLVRKIDVWEVFKDARQGKVTA